MEKLAEYRITVNDLDGFEMGVFGADCFLSHFPSIQTTGVCVRKCGEFYYIVEDGTIVGDTYFFSEAELKYFSVNKI